MTTPYIYVAASWRSPRQPEVVADIRSAGFEVYDFRAPVPGNKGFGWSEIDPDWKQWAATQFATALEHPLAAQGFAYDMAALKRATHVVMVQPCGRSAALELGYACGAGKRTAVLLAEGQEPELMLRMAELLTESKHRIIGWLQATTVRAEADTWSPRFNGGIGLDSTPEEARMRSEVLNEVRARWFKETGAGFAAYISHECDKALAALRTTATEGETK